MFRLQFYAAEILCQSIDAPLRLASMSNFCRPCYRGFALTLAIGALSCSTEFAPKPTRVRVDSAWVTSDLYSAIDPTTRIFSLGAAAPTYMTREKAEALAVASAHMLVLSAFASVRVELEAQRGGPIAFSRLTACLATSYARTPIASIPQRVPGALRRAYSSAWSVALCNPGVADAQLTIGVPDAPSDLPLDGDSIKTSALRRTGGGADFFPLGLDPKLFAFGAALTPEEAVRAAFLATARKVSAVPESMLYFGREAQAFSLPICAAWHLWLDAPTRVRGILSRTERVVSELYVKRSPACTSRSIAIFIPVEPRASVLWILVPRDTTFAVDSLRSISDSVQLPLNAPLTLEEAEIVR